jgi:GMP synthase (glutamine-hydrolysing)
VAVLAVADQGMDALGFLDGCFEEHGLGEVRMCHRGRERPWPVRQVLDGVDLVVSTGSLSSVCDEEMASARAEEQRLYQVAVAHGVPVLAICYGAQVLSLALGAPARRAPRQEIGFVEIESADPGVVPTGPWLDWHTDLLTIPVGATLLARTAVAPQAYVHGRCLAVQFHPEIDPAELNKRVAANRETLHEQGVDVQALTEQAHRQSAHSRAITRSLFASFWSGAAAG